MEGGGRGGDRYEGGNRGGKSGGIRGQEGVHVGGGETKKRGGERESTGRRRGRGKREEGGGKGERRKRRERVKRGKREFNYGLQDVDGSLAGSGVERAKGAEKGEARAKCRTQDGYWQVGANEEEKYRCESDSE